MQQDFVQRFSLEILQGFFTVFIVLFSNIIRKILLGVSNGIAESFPGIVSIYIPWIYLSLLELLIEIIFQICSWIPPRILGCFLRSFRERSSETPSSVLSGTVSRYFRRISFRVCQGLFSRNSPRISTGVPTETFAEVWPGISSRVLPWIQPPGIFPRVFPRFFASLCPRISPTSFLEITLRVFRGIWEFLSIFLEKFSLENCRSFSWDIFRSSTWEFIHNSEGVCSEFFLEILQAFF